MVKNIRFITNKICPFAQRAWIVLAEKKIPHEFVEVDLKNKPEWFVNLPGGTGKVPTLDIDGKIYVESLDVAELLDGLYPGEKRLVPQDPFKKYQYSRLVDNFGSTVLPAFYKHMMAQSEEDQKQTRENLLKGLADLEDQLDNDGPYALGAEFTLADVALYPFFHRFCVIRHYRGFELPESMPRIKRWIEAVKSREGVKSTCMPEEFLIEGYKGYAMPKDQ